MWIIAKILLSASAYLMRFLYKASTPFSDEKSQNGLKYYVVTRTGKHRVLSTTIKTEFASSIQFKLSPETKIDRVAKVFGFSTEYQTQDRQFDERIYIACDYTGFQQALQANAELRDKIRELFQLGAGSISSDGTFINVLFKGNFEVTYEIENLSTQLLKLICEAAVTQTPFYRDPFAAKILVVESIVWSLAIYAGSSFLELIPAGQRYIDVTDLLLNGLIYGAIGFAITMGALFVLFKGSSRGHIIIRESLVLLLFTAAVGGPAGLSDYNIYFDAAPEIILEKKILGLSIQMHKDSKGRVSYSYLMRVDTSGDHQGIAFTQNIELDRDTYYLFKKDDWVRLIVKRGRLNYPWIKSISPSISHFSHE